MSGVEVLKWIRDQPAVKRTKVLIFTSSEKPEDFRAANQIGADGYLLKPTKFDDLKNLVKQIHEEWLANKRRTAKPGSQGPKGGRSEEVADGAESILPTSDGGRQAEIAPARV
jgi:DNA-binding NarL/FixJ family response regulator